MSVTLRARNGRTPEPGTTTLRGHILHSPARRKRHAYAVATSLGLIVAFLFGVLGLSGSSAHAAIDAPSAEAQFVQLINNLRAAQGLVPLAVEPILVDVARGWSAQMAAKGSISHNPNLATATPTKWVKLGENVGVGMDVVGLQNAFEASPGHYRNLVDPVFTGIGIGIVTLPDDTIFVTQQFQALAPSAARRTPTPAAPSTPPASSDTSGTGSLSTADAPSALGLSAPTAHAALTGTGGPAAAHPRVKAPTAKAAATNATTAKAKTAKARAERAARLKAARLARAKQHAAAKRAAKTKQAPT